MAVTSRLHTARYRDGEQRQQRMWVRMNGRDIVMRTDTNYVRDFYTGIHKWRVRKTWWSLLLSRSHPSHSLTRLTLGSGQRAKPPHANIWRWCCLWRLLHAPKLAAVKPTGMFPGTGVLQYIHAYMQLHYVHIPTYSTYNMRVLTPILALVSRCMCLVFCCLWSCYSVCGLLSSHPPISALGQGCNE